MRVYSNQPMHEFLQNLRDGWIKHGIGQAYIDKLDELAELGDLASHEEELEAAHAAGYEEAEKDLKGEIDDLHLEIAKLEDKITELGG